MEKYLFSDKEWYVMAHNNDGSLCVPPYKTAHQRRKREIGNLHLAESIKQKTESGFPILEQCIISFTPKFVSYTKRNTIKQREGYAVHCFQDDYSIESFWNNLDKVTYQMKDYGAVMTPDYSLYVDAPEMFNKWQVYRSRFAGAFMQANGYTVIPTASWGSVDTMKWCFDGLPEGGVMAVCGTGIKGSNSATNLWFYAMKRLEEEKHPDLLYVYGDPIDIPSFHTELRFIPNRIPKAKQDGKQESK